MLLVASSIPASLRISLASIFKEPYVYQLSYTSVFICVHLFHLRSLVQEFNVGRSLFIGREPSILIRIPRRLPHAVWLLRQYARPIRPGDRSG